MLSCAVPSSTGADGRITSFHCCTNREMKKNKASKLSCEDLFKWGICARRDSYTETRPKINQLYIVDNMHLYSASKQPVENRLLKPSLTLFLDQVQLRNRPQNISEVTRGLWHSFFNKTKKPQNSWNTFFILGLSALVIDSKIRKS